MNIQKQDVISVIITLLLLAIWYGTLIMFNYPLISALILWIGMIVLSIIYYYFYKKAKRNTKVFKIRFIVSAIPIYPVLIYYIYSISIGEDLPKNLILIPFIVVFAMLILNALVVFYYNSKNLS